MASSTFANERVSESAHSSDWRKDIKMNAETAFNSRYMADGVATTENPVLNPSGSLSYKNLTGGIWSNMNFNEEQSQGKFNEVDFNIAYEWS